MKSKLLFSFGLLVSSTVYAQTYSSTDYAGQGDTVYVTKASLNTLNYDTTGTGITWDYSSLTGVSQTTESFVNPTQTGFSAITFPFIFNSNNTNLAQTNGETIEIGSLQATNFYSYYKKSTGGLNLTSSAYKIVVGSVPLTVKNTYTSPDVVYKFPLQNGNIDSSQASYTTEIPGIYYRSSSIKRVNMVLGTGTVITPYGTFTDALRLESFVTQTDSFALNGVGYPSTTVYYKEIKWFDASKKYPLLTVRKNKIGADYILQSIEYLDNKTYYQPISLFAYYPVCPIKGDTIQFQNLSTNTENNLWNFSDPASGTENTSTLRNPTHIFSLAGTYNVELITMNGNLSDTVYIPILVHDNLDDPTINISASATTICSEDSIIFTATSTNGGSVPVYQWRKNGQLVSLDSTYTAKNLSDQDTITCELTSSNVCLNNFTAVSNEIIVTVNPSPQIMIGNLVNPSSCGNTDGSIEILGSDSGTISWSGSVSGSQVVTLPAIVTNLGAGTYNFSFLGACASDPVSGSLLDPGAPATPIVTSSGATTFCDGNSVTLTSSESTNITWSNGEQTASITITENGSYFVTHTVGGCSSSSLSTQITVNDLPTPAVIVASGPTTFCQGETLVLSSDLDLGNLWSDGSISKTISVSSTGDYYVTTSENGCTSTSNIISVSVLDVPVIGLGNVNNVTSCNGNDGQIEITGSGSGTISWTGSSSSSQTVTLPVVLQNFAAGSYDFTFEDVCVSNIVSATVTQPALPTPPTITANDVLTFCEGGSVTLTSSEANGNMWSTGETTSSITVNTSGTYSSTITGSPGCMATSNSIVVTVNPLPATPSITSSGNTTFCEGQSVDLTSSAVAGNTWSDGAVSQTITVTSSGTYAVATSENGCSSASSAPVTITVNPVPATPNISASGNTTFCSGESVDLTSSAVAGNTWSDGSVSQTITVTSSGTYAVTTSENGCSSASSAPVTITVNPVPATPSISASGNTTFCSGESVDLTSSAATGNTWSDGSVSQTISVTSSGIYSVTASENGCISASSAPITITVNQTPPAPSISANGPLTFCDGENVVLTSDIANGIQWSTGSTSASITVFTSGTFTVTNTVNGCQSNSTPTVVVVNPSPSVSISPLADICDTADVITFNQGSPVGGTYLFDGITATEFTPDSSEIGDHQLAYYYTENGCTGSDIITVTVIDCSTGAGLTENSLVLQLYPNPSTGIFEISGINKSEINSIQVYDQVGKLVLTVQHENQFDLSAYTNGMYQLFIKTDRGESQQKLQLIK